MALYGQQKSCLQILRKKSNSLTVSLDDHIMQAARNGIRRMMIWILMSLLIWKVVYNECIEQLDKQKYYQDVLFENHTQIFVN
jgi:hypothetical protein